MLKNFYLHCLMLVTGLCSFYSLASHKFENISNVSHFQIEVVTELLEPYQIENPDGTLSGFSTEVVHALFKKAQSRANIRVLPWARAYEIARSTPNIMIYSIAHTEVRDPLFHWVGSLKKEKLYFWGLKSKFPDNIHDTEKLKAEKIAASRFSNVAQYLQANDFKNIYELIKEDQNMLMLYRGRVDLIVATELTLKTRAQKLGLDFNKMKKIKEVSELNNDLSIAFSKETKPNIVSHFRQAFDAIKRDGVIEQIKNKWNIQ